jgi:hypothetical protein
MATTPTTPTPNDVLRRWFDDSMTMLDPWVSAWTTAASSAASTAATTLAPPKSATHRADGCSCAGGEHAHACHCHGSCDCTARDADLLIVARVGERRIIPLVLHNEWRRERPVTIGVSAFRPCDPCADDVEISVATAPTGELVLPPCSRTVVDVIVTLPEKGRDKNPFTRSTTVYGDISTDGCARPVRLAVVVLPRDCDAHDIDCCGCGC